MTSDEGLNDFPTAQMVYGIGNTDVSEYGYFIMEELVEWEVGAFDYDIVFDFSYGATTSFTADICEINCYDTVSDTDLTCSIDATNNQITLTPVSGASIEIQTNRCVQFTDGEEAGIEVTFGDGATETIAFESTTMFDQYTDNMVIFTTGSDLLVSLAFQASTINEIAVTFSTTFDSCSTTAAYNDGADSLNVTAEYDSNSDQTGFRFIDDGSRRRDMFDAADTVEDYVFDTCGFGSYTVTVDDNRVTQDITASAELYDIGTLSEVTQVNA